MSVRGSRFVSYGVGGLLTVAAVAGCTKRRSTMGAAPDVNPPPAVEADAGERVDALAERSRKFDETVQQLPGRTPEEHRRAMQQVFAELAKVLPILYGPQPSGVFRQQLRVVESARTQLASAPQGLALEPTVDTGLRAARDALAGLASRGYFDEAQVGQTMDRLNGALDRLDTNRGAMHQTVVAEAAGLMSQAIRQMSEALSQRIEGGAQTERSREPAGREPAGQDPAQDAAPDRATPEAEMPDAPDAAPDAAPEPAPDTGTDPAPDAAPDAAIDPAQDAAAEPDSR